MAKVGGLNTNGGLRERAVRNWSEFNVALSDLIHTYFDTIPFAGTASSVTTGALLVFSGSSLPLFSLPEMSLSSIIHSGRCFGIWRLLINFATSLVRFDSWSR